jgi:hypothetical protein
VKIPGEQFHALVNDLHAQAREGIVVLPYFCDLVAASADSELQIIQEEKESNRVAALEKELATALSYISACKDCETCKHIIAPIMADDCMADCENCPGGPCKGICKTCRDGSNWEWRGACGNA